MKTTLTYTSPNALVPWPTLLTEQLDHWHSLTTLTAAEVVLDYKRDDARAYRVNVRLKVLGPDLHAEASDATLEGALLVATRDLEHQIQARKSEPLGPEKSSPPPSASSRRRTSRKT